MLPDPEDRLGRIVFFHSREYSGCYNRELKTN